MRPGGGGQAGSRLVTLTNRWQSLLSQMPPSDQLAATTLALVPAPASALASPWSSLHIQSKTKFITVKMQGLCVMLGVSYQNETYVQKIEDHFVFMHVWDSDYREIPSQEMQAAAV